KWTQTLTYAPHFISVVVVVGMMVAFLDPKTGLVNHVLDLFGKDSVPFLTSPDWFRHNFVWSGQWETLGWNTIIYLADLAGVNPELHMAGKIYAASLIQYNLIITDISIISIIYKFINIHHYHSLICCN